MVIESRSSIAATRARLAASLARPILAVPPPRPAGRVVKRSRVATIALCVLAVAGCSTPRGVPSGSSLVTEATVKGSFQAPADGMLWIFRTAGRGSRGQLHYSGPIAAGEVLVIDPSMNKATIDGRELELVLPGGDVWYQAYFRPDRSVRRVLAERPARVRNAPSDRDFGAADPDGAAPARDDDVVPRTNSSTPNP